MSTFLLAIPAALGDLWWVYHIVLLGVILLAMIVLSLLKKQDTKKDGERNIRAAATQLEQLKTCAPLRRKAKLMTTENLLKSAIYNLTKYAEKHDDYEMTNKISILTDIVGTLSNLQKNSGDTTFVASVSEVLAKINT